MAKGQTRQLAALYRCYGQALKQTEAELEVLEQVLEREIEPQQARADFAFQGITPTATTTATTTTAATTTTTTTNTTTNTTTTISAATT